MKSLAWMYVWWPGITKDIERAVRQCSACQLHQSSSPAAPLHPWSWPTRSWARLHLDYAGPVEGMMILILIDVHSKWIKAICTRNAMSSAVIEELRSLFAQFGLPETLVTDNGTCFVSAEFEAFLADNGIKHLTSAPYHPASNSLAEHTVQIIKKGLRKITQGSMRTRLAKIPFTNPLTPQSTTGISPSKLLLGCHPRSRLDLLKPNTAERVESNQQKQKDRHNQRSRERNFAVGDDVFVRNYHQGDQWLSATIEQKTGPVSYKVKLEKGKVRRCHQDQIRNRSVELPQYLPSESDMSDIVTPTTPTAVPLTTATEPSNSGSIIATSELSTNAELMPDSAPVNPDFSSMDTSRKEKTYPKPKRTPVKRFVPTWT